LIQQHIDLIDVTHELCVVHQLIRQESVILPIQIRLESDKLNLIGALVLQKPELLEEREYVNDLAFKLRPKSKESRVELSIILASAALDLGYLQKAFSISHELIEHLEALDRRSALNEKAANLFLRLASAPGNLEEDLKLVLASRAVQFSNKIDLASVVKSWKTSWALDNSNEIMKQNGRDSSSELMDPTSTLEEFLSETELLPVNIQSARSLDFYNPVGTPVHGFVSIDPAKHGLLASYFHILNSNDFEGRKINVSLQLGWLLMESDTLGGISFLLHTEIVYTN
jgi:hypothetical protein